MPRSRPRLQKRRYIRHPSRVPIRFVLQGVAAARPERLCNVGRGGLCFDSTLPLDPGSALRLTIPLLGEHYEADGIVAWCRAVGLRYEVGVRFLTCLDRFSVRMVEQLCYIEDYRQQVARDEGRELSSDEAAAEWIERFAEQFPGLH
jgi:hypothetical protein